MIFLKCCFALIFGCFSVFLSVLHLYIISTSSSTSRITSSSTSSVVVVVTFLGAPHLKVDPIHIQLRLLSDRVCPCVLPTVPCDSRTTLLLGSTL